MQINPLSDSRGTPLWTPINTEKLHEVVGLYVSPPAHAIVLSVDEKSQIQALDRTQPGLPLKRGRGATMTHDYKRNGTTTLFAALNVLNGSVIGRNMVSCHVADASRCQSARHTEVRLHQGVSIVLLDAGPQPLGVGYNTDGSIGGPLEGAPTVENPATLQTVALFAGVKVTFSEVAEPESALQPAIDNNTLWQCLPKQAMWLWNGLRGGLIVPAADMQVSGLSGAALLTVWQGRGADPAAIEGGACFAYELAGYYAFSDKGDDKAVANALRQRVKFLVDDAPALASVVNPNAPLSVTDLHALYIQGQSGGSAESLVALANAGKNLSRTPVVKLTFGDGAGNLVVSQLLTRGRLIAGMHEPGPGVYGLRYDAAAAQLVLNMINSALGDGA